MVVTVGYVSSIPRALAQEIEQDPLLRRHWEYPNTPAARARRAADPTAYRFSRALFNITRRARNVREAIASGRLSRAAAQASRMSTAVEGTFLFPVIVGAFAAPDSSRPTTFGLADLNSRLWDQNYSDATHTNGSVRDYYEEVSYGRLHMNGDIYGYVQADHQVGHYVDQAGDEQAGFMDWLNQMITTVDTSGIDFSQYDGDGDGYVDTLVLIHNLVGAEAQNLYSGTTGFWSHRWSYGGVNQHTSLGGVGFWQPYTTNDPDPNAPGNGNSSGWIMIDDYVMQPLLNYNHLLVSSPAEKMIDIGVFTHELGHAFGLPDFYDTDDEDSGGESEGLGHWCLMATGSWQRSFSPAHMGAWCKIDLGWVTPVEITDRDTLDIAIPRVEDNEAIIKVHTSQMDPQECTPPRWTPRSTSCWKTASRSGSMNTSTAAGVCSSTTSTIRLPRATTTPMTCAGRWNRRMATLTWSKTLTGATAEIPGPAPGTEPNSGMAAPPAVRRTHRWTVMWR